MSQLSLIEGGREVEVKTFSYVALDRDTEVQARADAELIKHRLRRTAEDVVEIGLALIRQKNRLPHGSFLSWIGAEFGMTDQAARNFMRVADVYGKSKTVLDLKPTALYELAAPSTPEEVRAEVERRLASGELVSAHEVRRLKDEARAAVQRADAAAADADARVRQAELHADRWRREAEQRRTAQAAPVLQDLAAPAANVVSLGDHRDRMAEPAQQVEAELAADQHDDLSPGDFDIGDALHRAEAFSGALSTLDFIEVSAADFRALMARESKGMAELYRNKLNNARRKIDAILKEFDR